MNVITDVQKRVKVGFLCSWLTKMMGHVAGGMLGCGRDGAGRGRGCQGEGLKRSPGPYASRVVLVTIFEGQFRHDTPAEAARAPSCIQNLHLRHVTFPEGS